MTTFFRQEPFKVIAFISAKEEDNCRRSDDILSYLDSFKKFIQKKQDESTSQIDRVSRKIESITQKLKEKKTFKG